MPNQQRRKSSEKPSAIFATGRPLVLVVTIVPGLRMASTLLQQAALDVQIFDDGLDDPVDFGELRQIVFEVADGDQPRQRRLKEGGGLRLDRGFQSGGGNAVARGAVGVGRNDIEQVGRNTGIGQVRGDAGAHGARSQNGDFLDPSVHGVIRSTARQPKN